MTETSAELTLAEGIELRSLGLRDRLCAASYNAARKLMARPAVVQGSIAASTLPEGLVITDEAKAAEVADQVALVIDAEKELAAELKLLCEIPDAMIRAAREALEKQREQLAQAKSVGNNARVAYQSLLRRRAAELEAEQARLALEAQQRAVELGREFGEDDGPPPPEIAAIEVPRTVAGGVGKSGTSTRIHVDGIESLMLVPDEWLIVNEPVAKAAFDLALKLKQVRRPTPETPVVHLGVRFKAVESAVNRR